MRRITPIAEMQAAARDWRHQQLRVALVPTMGYLHEGHLSLIRLARQHADRVVVSIFVNPTQFGPKEDLSTYPRDLERDAELCQAAETDVLFIPTADEMYPPGCSTWVSEERLSRPLCGASRPGHFRGVTTIVAKLFNACLPDVAIFGRKDAQQARVIAQMTRDLNFPIVVITAPIVREADGLAMSSRNVYLTADERVRSRAISRGLLAAEAAYQAGERGAVTLCSIVRQVIEDVDGRIDYVEARDYQTLELVESVATETLIAVAAIFGKTRLLDNCVLTPR